MGRYQSTDAACTTAEMNCERVRSGSRTGRRTRTIGGISPESGSGPGLTPDGSLHITSSCGSNAQAGAPNPPIGMPSSRAAACSARISPL